VNSATEIHKIKKGMGITNT